MIDEATVEDRLRRTYAGVASRTTLGARSVATSLEDVGAGDDVLRRRAPGRRRVALVALVVLTLATSAVVATRDTGRHVVVGSNPPSTASSTVPTPSTEAQVPPQVTGTEQRIAPADAPSDIAVFFGPGSARWETTTGRAPHGFSVEGGTAFVVDDTLLTAGVTPSNASHDPSGEQGSCTFYDGTLPIGGQGYGIEIACVPFRDIADGTKHAVFLFPDFPVPAQDTTVWTHLPAGTAFVTFSGDGIDPLWERPAGGVAGFTVGVSTGYTGDNFTTAPHPVLRAYRADGTVLQQVTSPYLVNFITGVPGR